MLALSVGLGCLILSYLLTTIYLQGRGTTVGVFKSLGQKLKRGTGTILIAHTPTHFRCSNCLGDVAINELESTLLPSLSTGEKDLLLVEFMCRRCGFLHCLFDYGTESLIQQERLKGYGRVSN